MVSIFDKIKIKFNKDFKKNYEEFNVFKDVIAEFIRDYGKDSSKIEYITTQSKESIIKKNINSYEICCFLKDYDDFLTDDEIKLINSFIEEYSNIDDNIARINTKFIDKFYDEFKDSKDKIEEFIDNLTNNKSYDELIDEDKLIADFEELYNLSEKLIGYSNSDNYNIKDNELIENFIEIYSNLDKIIDEINAEVRRRDQIFEAYKKDYGNIIDFIDNFDKNISPDLYIEDFQEVLNKYNSSYESCLSLKEFYENENGIIDNFIEIYENFEEKSEKINQNYLNTKFQKILMEKDEINKFCIDYKYEINYNELIDDSKKKQVFTYFKSIYDDSKELLLHNFDLMETNNLINDFVEIYEKFYKIVKSINDEYYRRKNLLDKYSQSESCILEFIDKYEKNINQDLYVDDYQAVLSQYSNHYIICQQLSSLDVKIDKTTILEFCNIYDNFRKISSNINSAYENRLKEKFLKNKQDILNFNNEFYFNKSYDKLIDTNDKEKILLDYINTYRASEDLLKFNKGEILNKDNIKSISIFVMLYENFDKVVIEINQEYKRRVSLCNSFVKYESDIRNFVSKYGSNVVTELYIEDNDKILNEFHSSYIYCKELVNLDLDVEKELVSNFIKLYEDFNIVSEKINERFLDSLMIKYGEIKQDLISFNNEFKFKIQYTHTIDVNEKKEVLSHWEDAYNSLNNFIICSKNSNYKVSFIDLEIIQTFLDIYTNFDNIVKDINREFLRRQSLQTSFFNNESDIKSFIYKYKTNVSSDLYISDFKSILKDFKSCNDICSDLKDIDVKVDKKLVNEFLDVYSNFEEISSKINKNFIDGIYKKFISIKKKIIQFCNEYKFEIKYYRFIEEKTKNNVYSNYEEYYKLSKQLFGYVNSDNYQLSSDDFDLIQSFIEIYSNFDNVVKKINNEYERILGIHNSFKINKKLIQDFISKYKTNIPLNLYIEDYNQILNQNLKYYKISAELKEICENKNYDIGEDKIILYEFIDLYENFENVVLNINKEYVNRKYGQFLEYKPVLSDNLDKFNNLDAMLYVENKKEFLDKFTPVNELLNELLKIHKNLNDSDLNLMNDFIKLFNKFNTDFTKDIEQSFSNNKHVLTKIINRYTVNLSCDEYIKDKDQYLEKYNKDIVLAKNIQILYDNNELSLKEKDLHKIVDFINLIDNFDDVISKINCGYVEKLQNNFIDEKNEISSFVKTYNHKSCLQKYIDNKIKNKILKKYLKLYEFIIEIKSIPEFTKQSKKRDLNLIKKFNDIYSDFDNVVIAMNTRFVNKIYKENKAKIAEYPDTVNHRQDFYISNSKLNDLLENYKETHDLVKELLKYCKDYKYIKDTTILENFPNRKNDIKNNYKKANDAFIKKELRYKKKFFDNINGLSLDDQQREAVIIDEDTNQIIAGAGTGKTLTLQAKIKYLIEKRGVNPNEIIALSYSNASVDDLKSKINEDIVISTIHSLGNNILNENEEEPDTDDNALNKVIDDYFINKVIKNEKKAQDIVEFYSFFRYPPIDLDDISTKGELYDKEAGRDFESIKSKTQKIDYSQSYVTFNREYVKSLEELYIANFLFINGVEYEYERIYKIKSLAYKQLYLFLQEFCNLPIKYLNKLINEIANDLYIDDEFKPEDMKYIRYKPDFYLPEYGIYLEHFGVDKDCQANWLNKDDAKKYHDSILWKRSIHEKYGTKLIETYSYYQRENRLLTRLGEKLKDEGVIFNPVSYKEIYQSLIDHNNLSKFIDLIKMIKTFINHFKGNNLDKSEFKNIKKLINNEELDFIKKRHTLLYNIIKDVYDSYQKYLHDNKQIDFNDMINKACKSIEEKGCPLNYKYILVDEYQDVSYMRYSLLKAIQDNINSKIVVVGDDWQSIYRFSGCDVALFSNIRDYYENVETRFIESTYRNSQELINISGSFVMKNPSQIDKELTSDKTIDYPIKIAYFDSDPEEIFLFKYLIDKIISSNDYDGSEILVLGRNRRDIQRLVKGKYFADEFFTYYGDVDINFDRNKYVQVIYKDHNDVDIKFRTIHGSKGLEAKYVIVINLRNSFNGFPNKIEDDPFLNYVKLIDEEFEFAEERRLFYVALTRTKENCYLLSPKLNKSEFIEELEEMDEYIEYIHSSFIKDILNSENVDSSKYISYPTNHKCPECKTGDVILKFNNENSFFTCSQNHCDWVGGNYSGDLEDLDKIFTCPKCGDVVVKRNSRYGSFFSCTNNFCDYTMEDFSDSVYEEHKLDLKCPYCGANILLMHNTESNVSTFVCSSCDYNGGKYFYDIDDLETYGFCPRCEGVLVKKNGSFGEFIGCSNYKRNGGCKYSENFYD